MTLTYQVKIEEPAKSALHSLMGKDPYSAAGIVRALKVLKTDPDVHITGVKFTESKAVEFLRKQGFKIRSLKGFDFSRYRVFYFVDKDRRVVVVKEIIPRDDDTYEEHEPTPHIQRLRNNFLKYHLFLGRGQR
jgi:mRNA-degrading endonuclease RelE of RelBE toxin-antitoxin system